MLLKSKLFKKVYIYKKYTMKKMILYAAFACITIVSCKEQKEVENADKYKKNLEVAKQFIEAFSTKDSTKEASLLAENFKWTGPAMGQDSLPKDSLLVSDKQMMNTFNEIKLTNTEFVPGVDPVTFKLDGGVRVYGIWTSKVISTGKPTKFKYYAVFGFNEAGKIISLEEYANMEDLMKGLQ
jgi:hypothetical protein